MNAEAKAGELQVTGSPPQVLVAPTRLESIGPISASLMGRRPQDPFDTEGAQTVAVRSRDLSAALQSTVNITQPALVGVSAVGSAGGFGSAQGSGASITAGTGNTARTHILTAANLTIGEAAELGRALSHQPVNIREAARALADEFKAQVEELKRSKPNEPTALAKHNDLVALFEKMASGLAELADALDEAIKRGSAEKPEPVFLGKAAEVVRQLNLGLMEWLEENRTLVIEIPIRIGLFGMGVAFLHSIGADSWTAVTGLATLALKRARPNGKPKRHR